jgi:HlyD family secretion protein
MLIGKLNPAALERLSTPDRLDQLIRVTSPRSWLVLLALLLAVSALGAWALLGRVTTRVEARGILVGGGVADVAPLTSGALARLAVTIGDEVREGDVVADIAQPELERQLADAVARGAELRSELRQIESFGSQDLRLQESFLVQQRQTLERQIRSAEERQAYLERQLAADELLQAQGLITRRQLESTRQALNGTVDEVARSRAELTQLSSRELTTRFDRRQQLELGEQRIRDADRLVTTLSEEIAAAARVVTPVSGRVLEVLADIGALVTPGRPLLKVSRLELGVEQLQAVLYVATADGKKVTPGMQVRVAPATVKPEEHGFIIGRVVRVAEFPATTQGMLHVLKNDRLVSQLAAVGAPFEVIATLEVDRAAASGFRWTSGGGPDLPVRGGTPATAWIEIEARRPVTLVVPALRRLVTPKPAPAVTGAQ